MLNPDNRDTDTASWLWQRAVNIKNTIAETYLRHARGYGGPIPPTFRFLPAYKSHKPALLCPYGLPEEITGDTVPGVHLIKLNGDGSDRFRPAKDDPNRKPAKQTLGSCPGVPIVCRYFDDAHEKDTLVIAEGVEDVLSACEAMNFAGWAAGGAMRMAALAGSIPDHVCFVYILVDDDDNEAGKKGSFKLAHSIWLTRDVEVFTVLLEGTDANQFHKDHGLDALRKEIELKAERYEPPPPRPNPKSALPTEDAAALAFIDQHGETIRYNHSNHHWHIWDGTRWRIDKTRLAFSWARDLCRNLGKVNTSKMAFSAAVERFAQADQRVAVWSDLWDRNIMLLGTPAGTVDLNIGKLYKARQEDFITKSTKVTPAESADCSRWIKFLHEATDNDDEMIRFLKQWSGYCLTGSIKEHALVFLHGDGGNGKGVFQNVISKLMGDYATTAAMETLVASKYQQHSTDLASLHGARLVTASETDKGHVWAEAKIKQMTGGDTIKARFMRCDFFEFVSEFKLQIIGNHMPALNNVDQAARRRFNIVPFNHKPKIIDKDLEQKLIDEEGPQILRWMVDGCLDWQENGLTQPSSITNETEEYFTNQDSLGQWIEMLCISRPSDNALFEASANLYGSWRDFCAAAGEPAGTQRALTQTLTSRGYTNQKTKGPRLMRGICLTANESERVKKARNEQEFEL